MNEFYNLYPAHETRGSSQAQGYILRRLMIINPSGDDSMVRMWAIIPRLME